MKAKPCEIGQNLQRFDAFEKVTGHTEYAADFYEEGMLWVGVKRSEIPHARLLSVDTGNALKIKGVKKILTARDIKGSNKQGVVRKDQEVLVTDMIHCIGAAVAIVIVESRYALKKAINAIELKPEELEPLFDIHDAIK